MSKHYRVIVVGGGIVGASVLYHLTRAGWTDVALIERSELTAGSTWHAAAGFHAMNADPHITALQGYTIDLYRQLERESGQAVGMHQTGGIELASSPARWEWLKAEWALFQTLDMDARLVTPDEISAMCPIVNVEGIQGGLFDPQEGRVDPHGATHAYVRAARQRGAALILRNRVTDLNRRADRTWQVSTEKGEYTAEHVVNAAGLWARRVGRMAGIDLPLVPLEHHYLVTETIPELESFGSEIPAVVDLDGFTYLQQEQQGVLLGVYELNPRHWCMDGAEWHFGMELLPEDIERLERELMYGFSRFPALQDVCIKRWVNGAFTFTPDGNPLVGPVPAVDGYWAACGCMAGFSQCGAIGLALANWISEGDPGFDVFGMDVARFGPFACDNEYLKAKTAQCYSRRFAMEYPNEELPAGRPLKTTPCYDVLKAKGAVFGEVWGMETPLYFSPDNSDFVEPPTLRRSSAHDLVGDEVRATRMAAGLFETGIYARYEVYGPGSEEWLDYLLANRVPSSGKIRLAPMLSPAGKLMGDLTVSRLTDDRFWLIGSYVLQEWHMRWFLQNLPKSGVRIDNLSTGWLGFSLAGPNAQAILARASTINDAALPFLSCKFMDVGSTQALVARISLTGECGYEITVPASEHRTLWSTLTRAGRGLGLRHIGLRALDSLRLEKGYGSWTTEFAQSYTPGMSGLDRFIAFDKGEFIGRTAALKEQEEGADQKLVLLEIDSIDADAVGFEPVWSDCRRVGFVTGGAYGHFVEKSLALAYVGTETLSSGAPLSVSIIGEKRAATVLPEPAYDPGGDRLRS